MFSTDLGWVRGEAAVMAVKHRGHAAGLRVAPASAEVTEAGAERLPRVDLQRPGPRRKLDMGRDLEEHLLLVWF